MQPMDGIVPETRRKMSIGHADIERAQKFRERARSMGTARPEFKAKTKSDRVNLYKTVGNHPEAMELATGHFSGNHIRRQSEDETTAVSGSPHSPEDTLQSHRLSGELTDDGHDRCFDLV
jgi:hypothetical protein